MTIHKVHDTHADGDYLAGLVDDHRTRRIHAVIDAARLRYYRGYHWYRPAARAPTPVRQVTARRWHDRMPVHSCVCRHLCMRPFLTLDFRRVLVIHDFAQEPNTEEPFPKFTVKLMFTAEYTFPIRISKNIPCKNVDNKCSKMHKVCNTKWYVLIQ